MNEWPRQRLGDLAVIVPGKYVPKEEYVEHGRYWIYGSNSVMGRFDRALVEPAHVVVAAIGANAGAVRLSSAPSWVNNNAFALVPGPTIDANFLYLWLDSRLRREQVLAGTGQPYVKRPALLAQEIELPQMKEQRRIVDLIGALDAHLAALGAETEYGASVAAALRHDVFSSMDCGSKTAGEKFDMLLGRQKSARQSVGDHVIPYIRAANISEGALNLDDVQAMNFDPEEQSKYGLRRDDVLLVEGGTVGLAARWREELPAPVGFDKHVIRLRARTGQSTSEYALQWARWSRDTGAFDRQATGITIKALGFGRATGMPVPDVLVHSQDALMKPLATMDQALAASRSEMTRLRALRTAVLSALMSQTVVIPVAYNALVESA